jgi:pyruvate/2-oxoglutarate dehydrogenase complex dihydrolipoamide acyltransferase (E2) component
MSVELRLDALDASGEWSASAVEEAEVARRLVADGATVQSGQDLIEVVLDKVNVALSAPAAGVVRWHVQEGDLLQPGDVLATIEDA